MIEILLNLRKSLRKLTGKLLRKRGERIYRNAVSHIEDKKLNREEIREYIDLLAKNVHCSRDQDELFKYYGVRPGGNAHPSIPGPIIFRPAFDEDTIDDLKTIFFILENGYL